MSCPQLLPLVDPIPPARGKRARGVSASIRRPKQPQGSGFGKQRWVVERTVAWLHRHGRVQQLGV
jgi:transposase